MAAEGNINWAEAFEDAPVALMDRVRNISGAYITQASVVSITYKVFEGDDRNSVVKATGTQVAAGTLSKADVVFDAMQTTAPWTKDSAGYNLRYDSPGTDRATGGKWHRYEIVITPTVGEAFPIVWGVYTVPMAGS